MIKLEYNYQDAFDEIDRDILTSVECECGNKQFYIHWLTAPYTGGYCKITCPQCGEEEILIDDYSQLSLQLLYESY